MLGKGTLWLFWVFIAVSVDSVIKTLLPIAVQAFHNAVQAILCFGRLGDFTYLGPGISQFLPWKNPGSLFP